MLRIRPFHDADRDPIAQMSAARAAEAGVDASEALREFAERWSRETVGEKDVVLVASEENKMLGFIAIFCDFEPELDAIYVVRNRRRAGIGGALLKAAALTLIRAGRTELHAPDVPEDAALDAFFLKHGGDDMDGGGYAWKALDAAFARSA